MSERDRLLNGTSHFRGLLDASGQPVPVQTVSIPSLPLIDPRALPPLPDGVEARLCQVPGEDPRIVLFHPVAELHVEVSLLNQAAIPEKARELVMAAERQAMGEPVQEQPNPLVKIPETDLVWIWETGADGTIRFILEHGPLGIRLRSAAVMPEGIEAEKIRVLTILAEKLAEHWA